MTNNEEIREKLRKCHITYNDLLKYLTNFSHTTRISIDKILKERIKMLQS